MTDKEKKLRKIAREVERCPLCRTWGAGKAVPGEGNPDADIVFIGEAPGGEEAQTGRPFVGRSGQFLRERIRRIGLGEGEVFITSPVHYRPLRGTPSIENILHGKTHLIKQLAVIDPRILVLMGNTACLALLGEKVGLVERHGQVIQRDGRSYLVTFHPAFAMRFPEGKKGFDEDFEVLRRLAGK
jgi:DNA polymerase